jgi:hypothetical protein
MRKHCASVYLRKGTLLIASSSQTPGRYGLWIEAGPHVAASASSPPGEIAERLHEALTASRQDVPYPDDPKALEKPLLELAGVKSWRAFVGAATHCYVEQDDTALRIIPSDNDGRGFVPRLADTIILDLNSRPEALGTALLRALGHGTQL